MSDFVNSVLDELVPTFSEEAGDWERVVADAGAETPTTTAQPWPRPSTWPPDPQRPVGAMAPCRHGGSPAGGSSP